MRGGGRNDFPETLGVFVLKFLQEGNSSPSQSNWA